MRRILSVIVVVLLMFSRLTAQHEGQEHVNVSPSTAQVNQPATEAHAEGGHEESEFNPGEFAVHHIADANIFPLIGDAYLPLPCMLYAPATGWTMFISSAFEPEHHGTGKKAIDGYVLSHGAVRRITDETFPKGTVDIGEISVKEEEINGKKKEVHYVSYNGKEYATDGKTSWDGGLTGGGVTSFYDYSITKNVFSMLIVFFVLVFVFLRVRKAYIKREGMAPKGLQSFLEPLFEFIRDEVAKPSIGHKYEKYMPFLLSLFFFILALNLFGQIPFFPGGANVTGNISVTIVLAILAFLVTNLNGNKHYWGHILWMPGVPGLLKVLIITPVEILGVFIKPFTLLLRLFANIAAGHIVILSFVGLIFLFGQSGVSMGGTVLGAVVSVPLTLFMSALELLVAFLQAFVFTLLVASYIGAATEEHH